MNNDSSKKSLVREYLKAEQRRAESKSIWLLLGGIIWSVIGGILLSKNGMSEYWAIIPGSFVSAIGLMMALIEKGEYETMCDKMRDCANLSAEEFYQLRDVLNK